MRVAAPLVWPMAGGGVIDCRDKLAVLAENHAELVQVLADAFEDAVLMGVDAAAFRAVLVEVVDGLRSPHAR